MLKNISITWILKVQVTTARKDTSIIIYSKLRSSLGVPNALQFSIDAFLCNTIVLQDYNNEIQMSINNTFEFLLKRLSSLISPFLSSFDTQGRQAPYSILQIQRNVEVSLKSRSSSYCCGLLFNQPPLSRKPQLLSSSFLEAYIATGAAI